MRRAGNTKAIRRAVATSVALAVGGWAALASPSAADPGNGNGNDNGNGNSSAASAAPQNEDGSDNGKDPKGPKDPKDPKGPKGNQGNNGNHNGQGQGQGNDDNAEDKGNNGNHNGQGQGNQGGSGGSGGGGKGDPAGNNGTVKITPHLQDDGIPQNTPHVTCIFDIEWYGFDEGPDIVSTVEFAMHAPTSDVGLSGTEPSQVFVGGDPASGAGTDSGFDGEATYMLAFDGEPHPQQGYHVKLTVHTPGSQGADTKHKVFWVQPCGAEGVGETAASEETTTGDEDVEAQAEEGLTEEALSPADEAGVLGIQATADELGADAEAAGTAAADVPNQVDAGAEGSLAQDVATSPLALLVIALGLLLAGAALVARRRTS